MSLITNHQCLLLFDGLNETQAGIRSSCLQAINDFAQRYPNHRYVLTTRPHGFSPLKNWDIVALRELDDQQIKEFLTRYTDEETADALLQSVLDAQNPLFRLPLFLTFVLRMRNLPLTELQTRINSRSGIIDSYVRHLIERDTQGKYLGISDHRLDHIYSILSHLADQIQHSGQTLPLQEAISSISQHASLTSQEAERIINMLCERGVLSTDRFYVRFWHHTIQEYFYAGMLVVRWRDARKSIRKLPRWLRRILRQSHEKDALVYMIAHLSDQELKRMLPVTSKENPGLAMLWADDLMAEHRCVEEVEQSLTIIQKFSQAIRRYSKLSTKRGKAILNLLLLLTIVAGLAELILFFLGLTPEKDFSSLMSRPLMSWTLYDVMSNVIFTSIYLLLLLDVLFHYPGTHRLEALFGEILNIRNNTLRQHLIGIAQEIHQSRLAAGSIKRLALNIIQEETQAGMETNIVSLLKNSTSLYMSIRMLAHVRSPQVLPVCEYLLTYNNAYSLAALQVLSHRAHRFLEEKDTITQLAWETWRNTKMDLRLRKLAGQYLHRHKEIRGEYYVWIWHYLSRLGILLFLSALYRGCFHALLKFASCDILIGMFILSLVISAWVWIDARAIGAKRIPGHANFDAWYPWQYWLGCFFFEEVFFPAYILSRNAIRRNAMQIDWNELEKHLNFMMEKSTDDIVSVLKESTSLYKSIQKLGERKHPQVLPVCKYFLTFNNAYSYAALQALTQRAIRFLEEKDTIIQLARGIWQNTGMNWKLRKLAGQFLHRYKEIQGNYYPVLIRKYLLQGTSLLLALILYAVFSISFIFLALRIAGVVFSVAGIILDIDRSLLIKQIEDYPAEKGAILAIIIAWVMPPILVWLNARKIGAKWIPGYSSFDTWYPWQYSLLLIAFPFMLFRYISIQDKIRRNVIQIAWEELEKYLKLCKHTFTGEKGTTQQPGQSQLTPEGITDLTGNIPQSDMVADIVSWLKESSSPYMSIQRLEHIRHPLVLPLCEHLFTYNNAYSYAALQLLMRRATHFSDEKETITQVIWGIWRNTKMSLRLRKLAGEYLYHHKEIRDNYYIFLLRYYLLRGGGFFLIPAVVQYIFLTNIVHIIMFLGHQILAILVAIGINSSLIERMPEADKLGAIIVLTISIVVFLIIPILVWINAKIVGIKCIPGYQYFDALQPWQYCLRFVSGFFLGVPVMYIFMRNAIRRNAIQIDWEELEKHLRKYKKNSISEEEMEE